MWSKLAPCSKLKNLASCLFYASCEIFKGFNLVPRAGVEPARVAPLVFETSASTDSAIWAFVFV